MRRLTALWAVLAFLALVFHGTTTASAASFTYDVPTVARVEVHEFDAPANPGRFSDARAGSASPSVEGRGTFTSSNRSLGHSASHWATCHRSG